MRKRALCHVGAVWDVSAAAHDGQCPRFAAGAQPVGAEPHGVGRVGRVGRVGSVGRDGAGSARTDRGRRAALRVAPGAYNMRVWWQQELARQAAEAAEAAEEQRKRWKRRRSQPAALVRERSQDDEGPRRSRRTNPNADDEIDFENATVMVLGVPKDFRNDEADQRAMTDDEWAEFARLHAAERAAYPGRYEPDAAADADGADGADDAVDDAGDDALRDHSSSGPAAAAAASSSSAPAAPAAGPPMPVPNRRGANSVATEEGQARDLGRSTRRHRGGGDQGGAGARARQLAGVEDGRQAWRNQVRGARAAGGPIKRRGHPARARVRAACAEDDAARPRGVSADSRVATEVADAGGMADRRFGKRAFNQCGAEEVDKILQNGTLWMKGQTGKELPVDQGIFLFNGPRYEPGVGPADEEGKPIRKRTTAKRRSRAQPAGDYEPRGLRCH